MDAYSFVDQLRSGLLWAPNPPGNANPSVSIPNPLNPATHQVVGPDPSALTWSSWLDATKQILGVPARLAEGSFTAFSQAGQKASTMVKTAIDTSVSAVTGTVGLVKWIVVGLVAFAILYGLFLIGPAIGGLTAPISGRGK